MIEVSFEVEGQRNALAFDATKGRTGLKSLDGIAERQKDIRPALDRVHDIMLQAQREVFDTEGRSIAQPWPKYTGQEQRYYTPMKRKILGNEYPLLRWKGGSEVLYPSLTQKNAAGHVWKPYKDGFEFGTNVPYAIKHHKGIGKGWRDKYPLPRRPLLASNFTSIGKVVREIQAYIFGGGAQARARGGVFG